MKTFAENFVKIYIKLNFFAKFELFSRKRKGRRATISNLDDVNEKFAKTEMFGLFQGNQISNVGQM